MATDPKIMPRPPKRRDQPVPANPMAAQLAQPKVTPAPAEPPAERLAQRD